MATENTNTPVNESNENIADNIDNQTETNEVQSSNEKDSVKEPENKKTKAKKKNTYITSRELYEKILAHPNMRVCESIGSASAMRPLEYQGITKEGRLVFEYDFASTALHPHALCEDIIDLVGSIDAVSDKAVFCDDKIDIAGKEYIFYRKCTVNHDCKWILLHR